ncbi:Aminopeptidase YwaD [bacterium HR33]|nr:Aminopeptidase YwaD [bacterium HR33]
MKSPRYALAVWFLAFSPFFCPLVAPAQQPAPEIASIRKEDLRADLFFLAGDQMGGRLTGTLENRIAAEFIKGRFERLGLVPAGSGRSYYQPFNLMTATLGENNRLGVILPDRVQLRLGFGQDFYPHRFSASAAVSGPVVFAGFGIAAPHLGHDDYRGNQIRGSVVLVLDHEPGENDPDSPFDGLVSSQASSPLEKTLAAQERGAVAIIFVADVHNHPGEENFSAAARNYWPPEALRIERYTLASWADRVRIPAIQISRALAETLVSGTGKTLLELAAGAEAPGGFRALPLPGVRVELETEVLRNVLTERNVVGLLEGSDPRLKDEWVIVCAHFDHNGSDGNQIYNGADDDGSGTVGLLEIAEAYSLAAARGQRPRRSVLFAAWNAEERGLLGAWAYVENPLHPLDRTVAVLNMDMIGRNEEVPEGGGGRFRGLEIQTAESNRNAVNVLGYSRSPDLWELVREANRGVGLELRARYDNNPSNLLRRSDHWPFLQKGVPAIFFHTGLHPDYHTVYDRPEKINYEKLEKIVRLVYQTSWELAQREGRPRMAAGGVR